MHSTPSNRFWVAYITNDPEYIDVESEKYLGHFYWTDIYYLFEALTSKDVLIEEFLSFMEEEEMGPQKGVDLEVTKCLAEAFELGDRLKIGRDLLMGDVLKNENNKYGPYRYRKQKDDYFFKGCTDDSYYLGFDFYPFEMENRWSNEWCFRNEFSASKSGTVVMLTCISLSYEFSRQFLTELGKLPKFSTYENEGGLYYKESGNKSCDSHVLLFTKLTDLGLIEGSDLEKQKSVFLREFKRQFNKLKDEEITKRLMTLI